MRQKSRFPLLVLVLASCSNPDPTSRSPQPPSAVGPAPAVPAAAAPSPAASSKAPAPVASDAAADWLLALDGEGLRIINRNTGVSRLIAFGGDAKQSMESLGRVLVETAPASVENEECRVDFARWSNGLTVWSSQSRFTGWSVTPGSSTISTASGVKIGSTRAELESAYDAEIMESSLGTEFLAGGLAGLLDSPRPDAKISNLWAGETCIAR